MFPASYWEVLANAIKQKRKINSIQIGKKDVKLSLFADYMTMCRKSKTINNKKLLLAKKLEVTAYKVNIQTSIIFLSTSNEELEFEIKNTTVYFSTKKK